MNTITRRRFASLAAVTTAGFALGIKEAAAEYVDLEGEISFESWFTGAEISVGDSGMEFTSRFDADDVEVVMMSNETSVTAIKFVPANLGAEDFLQGEYDVTADHYPLVEETGYELLDDGGWFAMGIVTQSGRQRGNYVEYQTGAFPNYDLLIDFTADLDTFEADFDAVQQATIAGMAPFLFADDSQVLAMSFPALTLESGTTGNSRSNRTGSGNDTETTNTRSTRGSSSTTTSSSYVEDVQAHRDDFLETFDEFNEAMAIFADDNRTDAEVNDAFTVFTDLALIWSGYPGQAQELGVPSEYADLEIAYLQWADDIGLLGELWLDVLQDNAEVAEFFDQIDVVIQSDQDLEAALEEFV